MKQNIRQEEIKKDRKGSALLLTVILLFVVLSMVVSLSYVTVMEQKMSQKTKSSVGSFFKADSGVEWALNKIANADPIEEISTAIGNPANGVSCPFGGCTVYLLDDEGKVITDGYNLVSDIKAVRSVGTRLAGEPTQRAVEAAVAAEEGWVDDGGTVRLEDEADNVGVGTASPASGAKLEVDGVIKSTPLGSDPTCNPDLEGGVYYDSDDDMIKVCTSAGWKKLDYAP